MPRYKRARPLRTPPFPAPAPSKQLSPAPDAAAQLRQLLVEGLRAAHLADCPLDHPPVLPRTLIAVGETVILLTLSLHHDWYTCQR